MAYKVIIMPPAKRRLDMYVFYTVETLKNRQGASFAVVYGIRKQNGVKHMREMEFKMERPGLLKEGDRITVTEGVLPSNYYYTIDPSLAMSGNFPFRERMLEREGVVTEVKETARGYYVVARFGS